MPYTFAKRTGPIKYSQVKNLKYYKTPNPFSVNSGTGGNCTWYAWGRFWEVLAIVQTKYKTSMPKKHPTGNAVTFYDQMKSQGYKVGITPKPGAIICWGYNSNYNGNPGHVAFVEKVNMKNGVVQSIEISQSGWSSGPLANRTITPGNGKQGTKGYVFSSGSYFKGFIYNPVDFGNPAGAVESGAPDHPQSWYIDKYGNEARVYFQLINEGLSHKAACAIMGNMKQESGFNPKSVNSIGATGLCQWYQGRCTKMKNYKSGYKWNTIEHQIKYLMYELQNGYKAKVYNVLIDQSKSLYDMTYAFLRYYEIPGNYDTEIKRRYANAQTFDERYSGAGAGEGLIGEYAVNMQQRSSQLYSSANYNWITQTEQQPESATKQALSATSQAIQDYLHNIKGWDFSQYSESGAVPDNLISLSPGSIRNVPKVTNAVLPISQAMVEAPFVEVDFGGTVVGTYNNSVDKFPNHISKLEVEKVNGEINKYAFDLVHQIRAGEDPNLMDKIISKVRYSSIKIRYGDYNSNVIYGDEKAIITNVSMNRDYVSNRISYTIYATSAGELVTSYKLDFPAQSDKPSTIINNLLYNNSETSDLLLDAFPGMKNKSLVNSNNLIPTNDVKLNIDEKYNISSVDYINYLVGCMSNTTNPTNSIIRNSNYYISYENDFSNLLGGAFFKISEITKGVINNINNNIFEVTVGYPDNNYVMGFSVDNNVAWSILYENRSIADEYIYYIDDQGKRQREYSPNLISSATNINEIQKNWWTQMINFPINASLTLKGLMKPVMLMNYIIIDVVFYGQRHITSGVYTITGQKDILSGEGFRTILSLTRVGD